MLKIPCIENRCTFFLFVVRIIAFFLLLVNNFIEKIKKYFSFCAIDTTKRH